MVCRVRGESAEGLVGPGPTGSTQMWNPAQIHTAPAAELLLIRGHADWAYLFSAPLPQKGQL